MDYKRWIHLSVVIFFLCFPSFNFAQEKPAVDETAIAELASKLVAAETDEERAGLLDAGKELVTEELCQALTKEGKDLFNRGELKKSFAVFTLEKEIAERLNYKQGLAKVFFSFGVIYRFQGDFDQSLECSQKSLALFDKEKDENGYTLLLNSIAIVYIAMGRYDEAVEVFQPHLKEAEAKNDRFRLAYGLGIIGDVYFNKRNYDRALANFLTSLKLFEELDIKFDTAGTLGIIGGIYAAQNKYEQALNYFQKCMDIFEQLNNKLEVSNLLAEIGYSVYLPQGKYDQALDYFQKSVSLSIASGIPYYIAVSSHCLGIIYRLQGKYEKALEIFQNNLTLVRLGNFKFGIATTLNEIANVYLSQGNFEKALESSNQAAKIAQKLVDSELLWRTKLNSGIAYRSLGKPEQSRKAFEESIRAIETIRNQTAGGAQTRFFFFQDKIAPYHEIVSLLAGRDKYEALSYAEQAKARVILDVLKGGRLDITKAMTAQELDQEKSLKSKIAIYNTQIYNERQSGQPDELRLADIEKNLNNTRLELEAFQTTLYTNHPELRNKRAELHPISLKEMSGLLPDPQSALLEFVVTEDKTFLFVLTQESQKSPETEPADEQSDHNRAELEVYTIDIKQKDLEKLVKEFRGMMASKDLAFRKPGHVLYDLLLKPAQEKLRGRTTLVIVPEGILWDLPFQVLQTPANHYLLEDHAISLSPSLTALREVMKSHSNKQSNSKTLKTLLAVGNPYLGKEKTDGKQKRTNLLGSELEPLPGTEAQVRILSKIYGPENSKFYIGKAASEERVKAEAGNYRILQFATHGILNNNNPIYSHLVLSQTGEKEGEDGLLEAWEISQMDLNAEMAILAACETARGTVGAGEGVIGLSWALFIAGCPTTVVSQWKVEDNATKELMLEFHKNLKTKLQDQKTPISKAEALRRAALKVMQTSSVPHPFYWAGFVMIGDGR